MLKIFSDKGGLVVISSAFLAFSFFPGCQTRPKPEADGRRIILIVEVRVSDPVELSAGTGRAGLIVFYDNYSYLTDMPDGPLKQRICSVFGRIIAEGRAQSSDYRPGRPDLSTYRSGIPISDRNFIFALVETAERRLNSGGQGARVYFIYKNNK